MKAIETVESADLKKALPQLNPGDTVRVHVRVKETNVKEEIKGKPKETERERVQVFEGVVIGLRGSGARATMTVRKVSFGTGVERIFPLHARTIEKIEVVKHAQVRRAKLYYLRELKGKAGRMKERRVEAPGRGRVADLRAATWPPARPERAAGDEEGDDRDVEARPAAGGPSWRRAPLRHALRGRGAGGGPRVVAGVDEVGRGALCGPVVAAAVVLGDGFDATGLDDSKRLTRRQREALDARVRERARAFGIGLASPEEIDRVNILQATLLAMRRAVSALPEAPDLLLVDALTIPGLAVEQRPIVKGDALSVSIAAASIVAKVERDALMRGLDHEHPGYDLARNMGYGSEDHREALRRLGPTAIHRRSFHGTQAWLFT